MMRLLSLVLFFFIVSSAYAEKNNSSATVSPSLYKKLSKAEQLISKKSYQQAEQKLKTILKGVKENSYGHAVTLRSLSSVYALTGKYTKAAQVLLNAIRLDVLPDKQQQQAILNLGRLYMAAEQHAKAIQTLEPWLANNANPDTQISALIANAYTQLKQYRKALPYIKKAIAGSKKPAESWLQLNLALYYELENYSPASKMLVRLIQRYPDKKTYWNQLSSVYQQLKHYKKAVSIKHLAYKKGFITSEKELLDLANLFLYVDSPYKAANLLKQELSTKRIKSHSKNWEKLAQAWQMAKEFDQAIKAFETASNLNDKGQLYQQLGQIYVTQTKWKLAINSLNKALAKGSLKNTGTTYILLGMSHYELNNMMQAKKYFSKASHYQKNKKSALQWLNYIDNDTNQS
jgi:tetratricopeptide (TPR) repeat protein